MRDPLSLPASPADGVLNVVVESPAGATSKIKWEIELEAFALSRPLPLGMAYPHDWGFVPGTRAEDGDPVDALVLSEGTTYPGLVIPSLPLGVVRLERIVSRAVGENATTGSSRCPRAPAGTRCALSPS